MSVIFLLIPLSVLIATGFLGAFIWAVRSGQYEDTYTPSMRLLHDQVDEIVPTRVKKAAGPAGRLSEAVAEAPVRNQTSLEKHESFVPHPTKSNP